MLTVGQYLRPTENHLPIVRYWHPDEFKALEAAAYELGFEHVAAGPLVRSSYHADQHVAQDEPGVGPLTEGAPHEPAPPPRILLAAYARGRRDGAARSRPTRWPPPAAAPSGFSGGGEGGGGGGGGGGAALFILFQLLFRIALLGHGLGALFLIGLLVIWFVLTRGRRAERRRVPSRPRNQGRAQRAANAKRERRVELAAAEAAEDDPAFAPDVVRPAAARAVHATSRPPGTPTTARALTRTGRAPSC